MKRNGLNINDDYEIASAWERLKRGRDKLTRQVFNMINSNNFDTVLPKVISSYMIAGGALHASKDGYCGHGAEFFMPVLGSHAFDVDSFGNVYGIFYGTQMNISNATLQWDLISLRETLNPKSVV
jgi:hypothetical protein